MDTNAGGTQAGARNPSGAGRETPASLSNTNSTSNTTPLAVRLSSPTVPRLSVAALRRSSPHTTPTRTLQLSEQEIHQAEANDTVPHGRQRRVTLESLMQRPRSNQRNRTPRRTESPLDPDEFRRTSTDGASNASDVANSRRVEIADQPRRITIRPGVGGAVGAVLLPSRIREQTPERSAKQGPSHRKVRRWNNDRLENVAAEIAPSSRSAAHVLLKGKEDAHLYREVYDPMEHQSQAMNQFMDIGKWNGLRDRFFEGELPVPQQSAATSRKPTAAPTSAEQMLFRIDNRLRRVVVKACQNSYPAARVVKTFETFLLKSFRSPNSTNTVGKLVDNWWDGILLEQPTITRRKDGKLVTTQFYFDPSNATGGFHRLLLHAVSQFHGLSAVSRMAQISIGDHKSSRALSVMGAPSLDCKYWLIDTLSKKSDDDCGEIQALGAEVEDSWTVV